MGQSSCAPPLIGLTADLEVVYDKRSQGPQTLLLEIRQSVTGLQIQYKETAEIDAIVCCQGCSGVKSEMRFPFDEREVFEALILAEIIDCQEATL